MGLTIKGTIPTLPPVSIRPKKPRFIRRFPAKTKWILNDDLWCQEGTNIYCSLTCQFWGSVMNETPTRWIHRNFRRAMRHQGGKHMWAEHENQLVLLAVLSWGFLQTLHLKVGLASLTRLKEQFGRGRKLKGSQYLLQRWYIPFRGTITKIPPWKKENHINLSTQNVP